MVNTPPSIVNVFLNAVNHFKCCWNLSYLSYLSSIYIIQYITR